MSDFRPCKLQIGERQGCLFGDTIYLPISPSLLSDLAQIFEEKALEACNYMNQGSFRAFKDYFQDAYNYWRKMREEYDRMNPEEEKDAKTNP